MSFSASTLPDGLLYMYHPNVIVRIPSMTFEIMESKIPVCGISSSGSTGSTGTSGISSSGLSQSCCTRSVTVALSDDGSAGICCGVRITSFVLSPVNALPLAIALKVMVNAWLLFTIHGSVLVHTISCVLPTVLTVT